MEKRGGNVVNERTSNQRDDSRIRTNTQNAVSFCCLLERSRQAGLRSCEPEGAKKKMKGDDNVLDLLFLNSQGGKVLTKP